MAEFEVARQRVVACRVSDDGLTSRRGGLRERKLPIAGRSQHDQYERECKAIPTPGRQDPHGSHGSIFVSPVQTADTASIVDVARGGAYADDAALFGAEAPGARRIGER